MALVGLGMPGGVGSEVARRLAQMFPARPPVVIAAADPDQAGGEPVPPPGFHLCLSKPVLLEELLRVVGVCARAVACCDGPEDRTTLKAR